MSSTGAFGNWKRIQISLALNSGINTIRFILTSTTGGPYLDKISFFETPSGLYNQATPAILTLYPNPAFDKVFLKVVTGKPEKMELTVSSLAGNVLLQNYNSIPAGLSIITFPVDLLPEGIYIVRWKAGSNEGAQKLLIVR